MSSPQQAPTPYQPAAQPQADAAFQTGAGQLAAGGTQLSNQVDPQLATITSAVTNNPYYSQALTGAQGAASQATGTVAPQQFAGASQDSQIAALAGQVAPAYANAATAGGQAGYNAAASLYPTATAGASIAPGAIAQTQSLIPQTTQGASLAPGALAQTQSLIPSTTDTSAANPLLQNLTGAGASTYNLLNSMVPSTTQGANLAPDVLAALSGAGAQTYGQNEQALNNLGTTGLSAANQVLQTGFDPQSALYNQQYQQSLDQQNAINAMNGVSGSPYAAGVSGQESNNFNINWQNAQLARQVSALGAYDSAASTYAGDTSGLTTAAMNNLATGVNSGVNDYNSLTGQAVSNATNLENSASSDLANLTNTGVNAYTGLTSNAANNLVTLQSTGVNDYNALNAGAVSNLDALQTTGVNNYNALTSGAVNNASNLINTGTGALNSGINTATGALNTLGSEAIAGNTAASDLGTAGLNTLAGAAQLPSDIYLQQQQADLAALGSQITGTNTAAAQTQQAVADQGQYLNIGQTASQGAINAASANNTANAQASVGFGNLFGSILNMFSFTPIPIPT